MPCKTISLEAVATIGIDIGKNTFHLIRLDKMGAIVLRQKLSRNQVSASKQPAIERPRSRRRGVRARHHARGDRRDHRFGPLRGCAGAGSETMPERSHLSGLHGSGRHQVMQGRETRPTAGARRRRRRRWISRRRAMLRCRRLRRRPALSSASARLSCPCGRAVVAVIAHRALHGAVAEPVVAEEDDRCAAEIQKSADAVREHSLDLGSRTTSPRGDKR